MSFFSGIYRVLCFTTLTSRLMLQRQPRRYVVSINVVVYIEIGAKYLYNLFGKASKRVTDQIEVGNN